MKLNILPFVTALSLVTCVPKEPVSYEVARWQGFRQAAVSYTFDDQCPNQFAVALPIFDSCDFKVTLYPVINWGRWDEIRQAALNGHEIGSHTVSHPMLDTLSTEKQETELRESKRFINEQLSDLKTDCNTIAYPYCHTCDAAISRQYYIAGRGCSEDIVSATPDDYYNISSIVCGNQGSVRSLEDFQKWLVSAMNTNGWCVFLLHGIDNDGGYSPLSSETLLQSVEYLTENRETYWVATFRDVVRYAKERDAVSVMETQRTRSKITATITDTLDNATYNLPLTIRRPLPTGWINAAAKQNDETIPSHITTINQTRFIVFEAIPDKGKVTIERK
ncbi:MAG: polysaccharide deacetylase family protein [Dysgonamonadaceae bacterium]|nr:polysaccharide deacetylase family protein [Dysgonamonadaceae bacterium]